MTRRILFPLILALALLGLAAGAVYATSAPHNPPICDAPAALFFPNYHGNGAQVVPQNAHLPGETCRPDAD